MIYTEGLWVSGFRVVEAPQQVQGISIYDFRTSGSFKGRGLPRDGSLSGELYGAFSGSGQDEKPTAILSAMQIVGYKAGFRQDTCLKS